MRYRSVLGVFMVVMMLAVAGQVAAQSSTTGAIRGTVFDADGGVLPGVTLTVASPALVSGQQVTITDGTGNYRFPALPVGTYAVEANLSGFRPVKVEGIRITIGQTLAVDMTMELAKLAEEIVVTAEAPQVSVVSNSAASTLGSEYLERQPLPRNANALINYTPAVNNDSAYGATEERSNAFNLDGVDVSDPSSGEHWILPNVDWLAEVQVGGLGADAEYGGFTGAVFNLVTKSGGNEVRGDASVYYSGGSLVSGNTPSGVGQDLEPSKKDSDWDVSVSLGGPLVRDKAWYFISGEEIRTDETPFQPAEIIPYEGKRNLETKISRYLGKLTYQANPAHRFVFLADYDGIIRDRRSIDYNTLASAAYKQDSPNVSYNVTWDWLVNDANFFTTKVTGFNGENSRYPYNGASTPGHIDADSGYAWGNYAYTWKYKPKRTNVDLAWNVFADGLLTKDDSHSFKFGAVYERSKSPETRTRNGGFTYYDDSYYCDSIDQYFTDPSCALYSSDLGNEIFLSGKSQGIHLYAQDSWRLSRVTINAGARYTQYKAGFSKPDLPDAYKVDMIAPRVGVVWDVTGDARTALKAHYGRYYQGMFTYLYDRDERAGAFTPYRYCDYNFSTDKFDDCGILSTNSATIDPNIDHPYVDQYVLSLDRQLGRDIMVGVDYVNRKTRNLVAMVNTNNDYERLEAPDNPLTGQPLPFYDLQTPPVFVITNPSKAYRDYDSIILRFDKRYSDGWMVRASLVWADLKGDTFSEDGYASEWEDLNGQTNADGKLPNYSKWEFKLAASVDLPWEVQASAYYTYLSGEYWTPEVQIRGLYENGRPYVFMEKRGSQQYADRNLVDLRLAKEFGLGGGARLMIMVDGFNVLNSDTVLSRNTVWGRYYYDYPDPPSADGWDGPRSGYEDPTSIERPREIRLGARLTF